MSQIPETIEKNEFLMKMIMAGKYEKEVPIFGNKVKMRTLDEEETLEAERETNGFDMTLKVGFLRRALLAKSIVNINGSSFASYEEAKIFVGKLTPLLVEAFFAEYKAIRDYRDLKVNELIIELKQNPNSSGDQKAEDSGSSASSQSPSGSKTSIL